MMTPKLQRYISQITPFGIIFFVFGLIYALLEKGLLGGLKYYPSTGLPYDFEISLYFSFTMAGIGLVVGIIEVLYLKKLFAKKSFAKKIFFKTLIYILINYLFTVIFFPAGTSLDLQISIFDPRVWDRFLIFITSFTYLSIVIYTALTLIISLFYAEISENIGHAVLNNFFTGKYHKPIEEERIFMFLDMNSSTTIAEKLGHIRYFELLCEYFADISESVIQYAGEIYQYVGDELVVSWQLNKGLANNNCIQCYYSMNKSLVNQTEKYTRKYGLVPTFKAGFHSGKVTVGEIGVIKKDIIFTGDVLNATARIQSLCKDYEVDMIISSDLMKKLNLESEFHIKSLGENELRGRKENMILYTIQ